MSSQNTEITSELYVRSALFYLVLFVFTLVHTSLAMVYGPALPYKKRFHYVIGNYTRFVISWLKICCGVQYDIIGKENIPDEACVIYSKHQSTWETFFLQNVFSPQVQVIKKELLAIPFFGWAFSMLAPIAIDRRNKKESMAQIIEQGKSRLDDNIWVLIFPEGTRVNPGDKKPFSKGAARLAVGAGKPILPIAHNSGEHWPNGKFLKYPGTIKVVIGEPIPSVGKTVDELNTLGERWIHDTVNEISATKWEGATAQSFGID